MTARPPHEPADYVVVVATDAAAAMRFFGRTDQPVDLGPPLDPSRYRPGARRWGFRRSPTAPTRPARGEANDAVLAKVRKLLALAGNRSATEGEAAAAAAAAQRLIEQHRLDAAMLDDVATPPADEPIGVDHDPLDASMKSRVAWRGTLAQGIANANGCRIFWHAGRQLRVIGAASRVAAVRTLYAWLVREVERLGAEAARGQGRSYAHAWRIGCAARLSERLGEAARAGAREAKVQAVERLASSNGGDTSAALVRVERALARVDSATESARVDAWTRDNFKLKAGRRAKVSDGRGYADGRAAGDQIRLTGHAALGRGTAGKLGGGR